MAVDQQDKQMVASAPLPLDFFGRPTLAVARDLVGCILAVRRDGRTLRHRIVETEAYDGPEDLACHASKGRTKRTDVLYRSPGTVYVYLCYGMHWLVNFVTGPTGYPAAVLIRGVESLDGNAVFDGPGKLTRGLGIDGAFNGAMLGRSTGLWVEPRLACFRAEAISTGPRIGVDYAGPVWARVPYRFFVARRPCRLRGVRES